MEKSQSFLIDGISAVAKHNGVVRMECMKLGVDGKPMPVVELLIPAGALQSLAEALKKIT